MISPTSASQTTAMNASTAKLLVIHAVKGSDLATQRYAAISARTASKLAAATTQGTKPPALLAHAIPLVE